MIKSEIRWGVAAALASVMLLGGCMLLLDTDKLQEGTGAAGGAGGTAGSGGTAGHAGLGGQGGTGLPDASDDVLDSGGSGGADADAGPECTDDLSCIDDDPCTVDTCNTTQGKCEHSPHQGIGLTNLDMLGAGADHIATVQPGVDTVGVPVLTTDGQSFWLGYWYEVGTGATATRDVVIKRYQADPTVAPDEANLKNASFLFDDLYTSPALLVREFKPSSDAGLAKRLAVVVGGHLQGAGTGMYVRMLDPDSLQPAGVTTIPEMLQGSLLQTEFADPTASAPRALNMDDHVVVTWVYGHDLYTWDARLTGTINQSAEKHDVPNDVLNAVPIEGTNAAAGNADFGAVLEIEKPGPNYSADLWSHGNDTTLKNLDPNSGQRLGIAAGTFIDPPQAQSIVAWSYDTGSGPAIRAGGAVCAAAQCNAAAFPGDPGSNEGEGMYPSISTAWLASITDVRAAAIAQVLHTRSGTTTGPAFSAVLATAMALDLNADGGTAKAPINPPFLLVRGPVESPSDNPSDSPYGRTAIAVTPSGSIMVAWVEVENGKKSIRARRYGTTICQ